MKLKGNKGEWSEIYVFLKLLADGQLNAADSNLEIIPEVYYPIIKIIRLEGGSNIEFLRNGEIIVIDGYTKEVILKVSIQTFIEKSQLLLNEIKQSKGSSFTIPIIEEFLMQLKISHLSENKNKKTDITLIIYDRHTNSAQNLGFSIKSMLGNRSTLFNAGKTTNFLYKLIGSSHIDIDEININTKTIKEKIAKIIDCGYEIIFDKVANENFELNLKVIDTSLPQILGEMLLLNNSYSNSSYLIDLIKLLTEKNPLNVNLSKGHPFYEYKIKNFLTDVALGMTPGIVWKGRIDSTGGIIIVKKDGELVCFHAFNRNEFQEYLINNTRMDTSSTTRNEFGNIINLDGQLFFILNLQVRFKN